MREKKSGPQPAGTGAAQGVLGFHDDIGAPPPGQADGELRKLRALELLRARDPGRVQAAQAALLRLLVAQETATIDDVRDILKLDGGRPARWLGAVAGELSRAGIIERAGYTQTTRAVAHARPVSVWRLCNREAAEDWLASNAGHTNQVPRDTVRAEQ